MGSACKLSGALAFIIYIVCSELYFASKGGCVDLPVEGYILTFSMATWLRVDACWRIAAVLVVACCVCFVPAMKRYFWIF